MRISVGLVLFFVVLLGQFAAAEERKEDFPHTVELEILESTGQTNFYKLGILHGMNTHEPASSDILPHGYDYWRSGRTDQGFIDRIRELGASYQFVIGDSWGYGEQMRNPAEIPDVWQKYVRETIRKLKDDVTIWEIWNEPELKHFWRFSQEDYFKTWQLAHDVIRQELGGQAVIAGPSLFKFNKEYMTAFLDFALEKELIVDVLSWHTLETRISALPENVDFARKSYLQNPKYAGLKIRHIHIDEFGGRASQYSPGTMLTYFWQLENAGVDAAAKACWPNLDETLFYCNTDTLSGMLSDDYREKRAMWWLYSKYNESRKKIRHTVGGTVKWLPAIAWRHAQGHLEMLVGLADANNAPKEIEVQLKGEVAKSASLLKDRKEGSSSGFEEIMPSQTYTLRAGDVIWLVFKGQ